MRALVVVVIGLWSSQASAEAVAELTRNARMLASWGECAELTAIGARVRALDANYFHTVFSVDPDPRVSEG